MKYMGLKKGIVEKRDGREEEIKNLLEQTLEE